MPVPAAATPENGDQASIDNQATLPKEQPDS
jgi:hypothetical protein